MKSITLLFGLLFSFLGLFAQDANGSFHLDKAYPLASAGTIHLKSSDAKVYISGSNRTDVHVKIDRTVITKGLTFGHEEFAVNVTEAQGDLRIEERSNHVMVGIVGYHEEKYSITIEAPFGASLQVKGDDGKYWISHLTGAIAMDIDDADVVLSDCTGTSFDFRIDDGDIKMDKAKGQLTINGDDSDVQVLQANLTSLDADMDDGKLIIETTLDNKGEYRINAQDGQIQFRVTGGGGSFVIRHDDGRITADAGFQTIEDAENRTRLTLANGSARVDIHTDDARVRLERK
jgi:hypothetical protein